MTQQNCPNCHGRGWYQKPPIMVMGEMHGADFTQYPCEPCSGTGTVETSSKGKNHDTYSTDKQVREAGYNAILANTEKLAKLAEPSASEPTLIEKKQAVLTKVYGGERKVGMHDFRLSNGICRLCGGFIGEAISRYCPVIGADEVALFRTEEGL